MRRPIARVVLAPYTPRTALPCSPRVKRGARWRDRRRRSPGRLLGAYLSPFAALVGVVVFVVPFGLALFGLGRHPSRALLRRWVGVVVFGFSVCLVDCRLGRRSLARLTVWFHHGRRPPQRGTAPLVSLRGPICPGYSEGGFVARPERPALR